MAYRPCPYSLLDVHYSTPKENIRQNYLKKQKEYRKAPASNLYWKENVSNFENFTEGIKFMKL